MKANDYRNFKARVAEANEHDPIWYAGYLWIGLTEKQGKDMIELLKVHPSVIRTVTGYRMPGGLEIKAN